MISPRASSTTERVLEIRGVEHRDPRGCGGGEIDLVRPDAEGPYRYQLRMGFQHPFGDVGPGADPEELDPIEGIDQFGFAEGTGTRLDLVAAALKRTDGLGMDVF